MSRKYHYYYDPSVPAYYDALKRLAKKGGEISRELALLADLQSEVALSPDQVDWFNRYYDGSMRRLVASVTSKKKEMKRVWQELLDTADAIGIERIPGKDSPDYPLYARFYRSLCELEENCDLRSKVHTWANADLEKIEAGRATIQPDPELVSSPDWKPLEILSVPQIMARYDALMAKRAARSK